MLHLLELRKLRRVLQCDINVKGYGSAQDLKRQSKRPPAWRQLTFN